MSNPMQELAHTLQCGLAKIAELSQASKTAAAPQPSFDKATALVAATDTCRKLASMSMMSPDAVNQNAALLVSDHGASLEMLNEFVGALRTDSAQGGSSKQAGLGTVTTKPSVSTTASGERKLRC